MKKSVLTAIVLALLTVGAAQAQDKADRKEKMEQFEKRFAEADANGDGKLSREEAAKMPFVASHFDEIDTDKKGFVTKRDIAKAMKKMRGAKEGAGQS